MNEESENSDLWELMNEPLNEAHNYDQCNRLEKRDANRMKFRRKWTCDELRNKYKALETRRDGWSGCSSWQEKYWRTKFMFLHSFVEYKIRIRWPENRCTTTEPINGMKVMCQKYHKRGCYDTKLHLKTQKCRRKWYMWDIQYRHSPNIELLAAKNPTKRF